MSRDDYGSGSIYESDGRWYAEWTPPARSSGETPHRVRLSAKTKKEVKARLRDAKETYSAGPTVPGGKQTLKTYLPWWMNTVQKEAVRQSTYRTDGFLIAHVVEILGEVRLCDLKRAHLRHLHAGLLERGLAPATAHVAQGVFRKAVKDAVREDILAHDPFYLEKSPALEERPERLALTLDQVHALLAGTEGEPLYPLWVLLATTGLRCGEATALRWSDLQGDTLLITRTVTRTANGALTTGPPKTKRSRGKLVLGGFTLDVLATHRQAQRIQRMEAKTWEDNDLLFPGSYGQILQPTVPIIELARAAQRVGLPHITPHTLRHSYSKWLEDGGTSASIHAGLMRHANAATTYGPYGHPNDELQRATALNLEAKIRPPAKVESEEEA